MLGEIPVYNASSQCIERVMSIRGNLTEPARPTGTVESWEGRCSCYKGGSFVGCLTGVR
jgi:hypothetical protein